MNRFFILILSLIILPIRGFATPPAEKILESVISNIKSLNPYEVKVDVEYGNGVISGSYQVDNDKYYISVGDQELYGDSSTKREVNNEREEVIIDNVIKDGGSGNLLDNPATAFDDILNLFDSSILSENKGVARLFLKPITGDGALVDSIILNIDTVKSMPIDIEYSFNDESITVKIISIKKLTSTIKSYNSHQYADYEIIDFR